MPADPTGAPADPTGSAPSTLHVPPTSVSACLTTYAADEPIPRDVERAAVKAVLALLSDRAPGRSVELRIPPYAAVQLVAGATHRRGTPPALVETSARTLIELAVGTTTWPAARADGRLRASGERSDLRGLFPLWTALPATTSPPEPTRAEHSSPTPG